MRNAQVTGIILRHIFSHLPSPENFKNENSSFLSDFGEQKKCEAFLCRGECLDLSDQIRNQSGKVKNNLMWVQMLCTLKTLWFEHNLNHSSFLTLFNVA